MNRVRRASLLLSQQLRGSHTANQRPHADKSISELINSLAVFRICTLTPLVNRSTQLLELSRSLGLSSPVHAAIKSTFFKHFCGGENLNEVIPTMERFSKHQIGSILDLAMEADVSSNRPTLPEAKHTAEKIEKLMRECIDLASHQENSFIAVKITAFIPPDLLLRWTCTLNALKQAFDKHANANGLVGEKEFALLMSEALGTPSEKAIPLFQSFNQEHIDWISVSNSLSVLNKEFREFLAQHSAPSDITGEDVLLNIADFDMVDAVYSHLEQLCEYGKDKNVRILMDAEQTYFQPAIDDIVLNLCRTVNAKNRSNAPTIFNTYQMYLNDALGRLEKDVLRSERYGYHFGVKIVRGAYMTSERERALEMGHPDPIQSTIEHTHNAYNAGVAFLIKKIGENTNSSIIPLSIMVASHNDISVRKATELMKVHNVSPSNRTVAFAQLMGMKDGTSFSLANQGYAIYKYIPYGPVDVTIPYLIRRAQENSSLLGGVSEDRKILREELWRRVKG